MVEPSSRREWSGAGLLKDMAAVLAGAKTRPRVAALCVNRLMACWALV